MKSATTNYGADFILDGLKTSDGFFCYFKVLIKSIKAEPSSSEGE